jgi:hypothetical protein
MGIKARLEHIWTHEREKPDVVDIVNCGGVCAGSSIPALSHRGWLMSLGGTVTF